MYGMFLILCEKKSKLINKTSNGLECYNCHFNGIVPTNHPNLVTFTHAPCEEANCVVQRMEDINKGRENAPDYDVPVFPNISDEFWDKIEARKNEASKISGKKRGRKGKRKINVQSCSLYWNFVAEITCQVVSDTKFQLGGCTPEMDIFSRSQMITKTCEHEALGILSGSLKFGQKY